MASKMGVLKTKSDKKVCQQCNSMEGKTNQTPPFHPNCRCSIVGGKVFTGAGVPVRSYEMGTYSPEGYKIRD